MRVLLAVLLLAVACAHGKPAPAPDAEVAGKADLEVEDAVHAVRFALPHGAEPWQVVREGNAYAAAGVRVEVSSFPLAAEASPTACRERARELARERLTAKSTGSDATRNVEAPRDEVAGDSPASWSFTSGPASGELRSRWAFFARGADCLVLQIQGARDDRFADQTFAASARSFRALPLPRERQRDIDMLAGMGFLERRDPGAALQRFEALAAREPEFTKAHFGALMAGFELGPSAYARALPHGKAALRVERELTAEQRQLALRAMGVMQLAENQIHDAAGTLAELVVRAPDLAEAQYNYACALARLGDRSGALDHLGQAVRLDRELVGHARDDEDLKSLRGSPDFDRMLKAPPAR